MSNGSVTGRRALGLGGWIVASFLTAACGKTLGPEDLDRLEVSAGANQRAVVGTAVDVRPAVKAVNIDGKPIQGIVITFTVTGGGGTVSGGNGTTNAEGVAAVGEWILGQGVGENILTATAAGGLTVTFKATGTVGPAAQLEKAAGDGQSSTAGRPVPDRLQVRVVDAFSNPVAGAEVAFTVESGGGTISNTPVTSGTDGVATSLDWTLGAAPGSNTVQAVSGSATATFTATGVSGPVHLVIAAGDSQTATVASPLPVSPEVVVTDAQDLPVSGADVIFRVVSGGGTASDDTVTTDGTGAASVQWTVGTAAGSNTLAADIVGLGGVLFVATGTPDVPVNIDAYAGNDQFGAIDDVVSVPPAAIVEDQYGNPVEGVVVYFTVTSGGGAVSDDSVITDADGVAALASWTLGPTPGLNEVEASAAGTTTFTFTATALTAVYDIEIVRLGGGGPAIAQSLIDAVVRWQSLVVGDLPDVDFSTMPLDSSACGTPPVADIVDDVRIFVRLEAIDGPGNVLGAAGPCAVRDSVDGGLTVVGVMRFDIDDLDRLDQNQQLTDVVVHEIGHVMGFGTLPQWDSLLMHPSLVEGKGADTHFVGPRAIAAFDAVGGANFSGSKVPVENSQGGQATQDAHWRESVFDNELMTGFVNPFPNPLSIVTLEALGDLGYLVNQNNVDSYSLAPALPAVVRRDGTVSPAILWDDVRRGPIYRVDRNGRVTGVINR